MRMVLIWFCVQIAAIAAAQNTVRYTGNIEAGALAGSMPLAAYAFTTHGFGYGQYTFALGGGLDKYPFISLPLFAEMRKTFFAKKIQPFVQAAGGANFTLKNSAAARQTYDGVDGNFSTGFFAKGGVGLLLATQQKMRFSLSGGYAYKTAVFNYAPILPNPPVGQTAPLKDIYHFNRWYLGIGVGW